MTRLTYETITGLELEFEADRKLAAFVRRVERTAKSAEATEDDLIALVYSGDNPLLGRSALGAPIATQKTVAHPAYRVLCDLIEQKRLADRGISVSQLAKRYTITVADAAERLGVHESAVRQAIHAGRLSAWRKDQQYFLHPKWLEQFKQSSAGEKRGPKPRSSSRSARVPRE
jgi:excisionase family DNA binding protein